jgi:hypothetical protein
VEDAPVHPPEALTQRGQGDELLGVCREDVRRHLVEERLDGLEDLRHVVLERLVRVGVVRRVPGDLPEVLAPVLGQEQVVAVLLGGEGRRHQQRHEAVLRELELVDDVRPQQAQGVREGREPEAGMQLLGDRGTADEVPALEDQRPQAGLREVGAVDEAVVPAADDDGVVAPVVRGRVGRLRRPAGRRRHRQAVFRAGL